MAGRGMGCATRGGGAVESGPRNRMISEPSMKSGPVMMKKGGAVNQHKRMAMGEKVNGMMGGGMAKKYMGGGMVKGYRKGGMCS
jgi:hypothetical protein